MNTFVVSVTVLLTIVLSLTLGVGLGYLAVTSILRAMASHQAEPATASPALTTAHTASGGD